MGNSGDDAGHKIPYKMKTHQQNQLKLLVLVYFIVVYRTRPKKVNGILVQCPFKKENINSKKIAKRAELLLQMFLSCV